MLNAANSFSPSLHLGPMSARVIEAVVAFAALKSWPICLIASRRQIDAEALGGGYVDALTTEQFAARLKDAALSGNVILARDHGGPYQRSEEEGLSLSQAIEQVEISYRTDIENGFKILHIDPEKCVAPGTADGLQVFTDLTIELLGRCFRILDQTGKHDVRFEVGSDEGICMEFVPEQWSKFLSDVLAFCASKGRPAPVAMAVPLGTKVKEAENVGALALNIHDPFWIKRIQTMCGIAEQFGVKLKLHNADYVAPFVIGKYRELGVEQVNVAPELGVVETLALLRFLRQHGMEKYATRFIDLAYDSNKWQRWLKPNSTASREEKAVIAGHYVFATPECRALMAEIAEQPAAEMLDSYLLAAITERIEQYHSILEETYAPRQHVSA